MKLSWQSHQAQVPTAILMSSMAQDGALAAASGANKIVSPYRGQDNTRFLLQLLKLRLTACQKASLQISFISDLSLKLYSQLY